MKGRRHKPWAAIGLAVAVVVLVAAVLGAFSWLRSRGAAEPGPGEERCLATAAGASVAVNLDQAHLASIIVGLSVRRKLPARAASIAMATVYQETGIRNLDYGDRDSVGLFQQRPSQGWGTEEQLMDPYYATGKFYDALVKVKNWRTDDINDVAQKVQRSGYPDAYRDHEADARVLASTLTGRSPAGFTCLERGEGAGDATGLVSGLNKTFGRPGAARQDKVVTISATSERLAWAYASFAVANAKEYGLVQADVGPRRWRTQKLELPTWEDSGANAKPTLVTLAVR
ncbi:MAG TPA: hypothetical protein VEQ66_08630 [Propionibacteriaceae bacterium]|nr:hypothetical protein [Propionibacteriaceae bacterium]